MPAPHPPGPRQADARTPWACRPATFVGVRMYGAGILRGHRLRQGRLGLAACANWRVSTIAPAFDGRMPAIGGSIALLPTRTSPLILFFELALPWPLALLCDGPQIPTALVALS